MVGPLMNDKGETVKDPFQMAEILRKQYESAFSIPDPITILTRYGTSLRRERRERARRRGRRRERRNERRRKRCERRRGKRRDNMRRGYLRMRQIRTDYQQPGAKPQLKDVHFDHMDISEAIDTLPMGGGPGPDGISPILLKKSKLTVSLMLYSIFYSSIQNGEIPDILKLGYICPILKTDSKRENPASWSQSD